MIIKSKFNVCVEKVKTSKYRNIKNLNTNQVLTYNIKLPNGFQ